MEDIDLQAPLSRRDRAVLAIFDQLPGSMIISDPLAAFITGQCTKGFQKSPVVRKAAPKVMTGVKSGGRRVRDIRTLIAAERAEPTAA